MAAPGGGSSPPSAPLSAAEAFRRLLGPPGKKQAVAPPPKFIKKLDEIPEIALPEEPSIKTALALAERSLVGQFMGLWPSTKTTNDWIQRSWRPQLKDNVICYPVGRGFYIFEFSSKEDKDLIFRNGPYFMGSQGLYLNRWTPDFDPFVDTPKEVPVWVRLPGLPAHCWNPQALEKIGNGLGRYIDKADPKGQYSCARICVEVDLEAGLPEAIKVTLGDWHRYQKLDYEQLPFKCRNCHEHGHFQKHCPKIQHPEETEGWQKVKKGKGANKPQEKKLPTNTQKPGPDTVNIDNLQAPGNTSNNARKASTSIPGKPAQNSALEVINLNPNPSDGSPVEPGEIPQSEPEKEVQKTHEEEQTPAQRSPGRQDPAKLKDLDEDPTNLDSDTGGYSDGGASEYSSSHATPVYSTRGRKSKKKHREEIANLEVTKGTQQTIHSMMGTRGQASRGPPPPKKG